MTRNFHGDPTTATERDCAKYGHCWHVASEQHTIGDHRDEMCCWCNGKRCIHTRCRPLISDGEPHRAHGRFDLGADIGWEKPD